MRNQKPEGIVGCTRAADAETFHAGDRPIVQAIVEATAAAAGRDPFELEPLYDSVDPDALESLVEDGAEGTALSVTIQYAGHEVTVRRDGRITVAAN